MSEFYQIAIPLIIGFILDSLLGDPLWLPHPIRWFGNVISSFENKLNNKKKTTLKGCCTALVLISATYFAFYGILEFSRPFKYIYYPLASVFVFYGLANQSLITESLKVEHKLTNEGLEAGREQLSCIVGRDTSQLSENKIRIAILETLSENLSDGVIAPLFYYAIGGIPLMLAYKMVNTLDSMIGYKNERYRQFGFCAAKFDDIANFIPARITALLMIFITLSRRGFTYVLKFGHKHTSLNAGYPEAALAGILDCRFGGSNVYHGKLVEKPFIGTNNKPITQNDIYKACIINYVTSLFFMLIYLFLFHLFSL
ncbi:MAG: cobalamin biosynthesis protein CobD [Bacteroidetes bacterium]|nr:cobalamin biosynthesis protein CobD [Bacteroidota bacterium]